MTRGERWAMRLGILLGFVLVLCSSCRAQDKHIPQMVTYDHLGSLYGVTFCTAKGVYSFVNSALSPLQDTVTRVHEAKHRQQFARFPSCTAWQKDYNTPAGMLASEAEAYMAGWCVAVSLGVEGEPVRQQFAETIEHLLGGETNRLTIIREMQKYARCK